MSKFTKYGINREAALYTLLRGGEFPKTSSVGSAIEDLKKAHEIGFEDCKPCIVDNPCNARERNALFKENRSKKLNKNKDINNELQ